jgi:hypothetical protein
MCKDFWKISNKFGISLTNSYLCTKIDIKKWNYSKK